MGSKELILKSYLSKYKYADIAKRDILGVFAKYQDLQPRQGPFIFNNGTQKDLVNLDGCLPVPFRGNFYNIPINIFILDTHPYNPPYVYVRPTDDMNINPGTYVDGNGKVDLPYLRDWRYPQSDLLGLIEVLVIAFGKESPVYKRLGSRPRGCQVAIQQNPDRKDSGQRSSASATDQRFLCKECRLNPLEVTIQPCGHLATCESCCRRLKKQQNECPICSGPIDNVVRSFVPE
ncbi:ESCRT-I complex subunit TSG101 [Mytilus galloprovincialis]|uniref:ESCRT-I complex subunit TSG101 n=1 Tax=Mytilus galloprovincialis TaxID=29158 RepID=A0A8B6DK70_MYTGA|nr:ESCRT-I complex subunit TSG101 [Mytilus galloprovincialis]